MTQTTTKHTKKTGRTVPHAKPVMTGDNRPRHQYERLLTYFSKHPGTSLVIAYSMDGCFIRPGNGKQDISLRVFMGKVVAGVSGHVHQGEPDCFQAINRHLKPEGR